MQFRTAPHQTKKGKHESNTSDVLRTGEEQTATRDRELSWQRTGNPGSAWHLQEHILRMESRSRDWQWVTTADRKLATQLLSHHRIGTKCKERQDQCQRQHATTAASAKWCAYCRMRFTPFIVALLAEEFVLARPPGFNRAFVMWHLAPAPSTAECRRRLCVEDRLDNSPNRNEAD